MITSAKGSLPKGNRLGMARGTPETFRSPEYRQKKVTGKERHCDEG
jgi:hypothetical protein